MVRRAARHKRSGPVLWSTAWLMAFAAPQCADAQAVSLEDAVKATYLYKFVPFVEWRNAAAEFQSGAFTLCVIGDNALDGFLESAVSGGQVAGRPIMVRHFADVTGNPGCAVMYLTGDDKQRVAGILAAVRGTPVLTVTDAAADPATKGIINFINSGDRIRFEIDSAAAIVNDLMISSKLLSLAMRTSTR